MAQAKFSRIVIIQSLKPHESPTGLHLRDAIEPTAEALHGVSVEYIDVQTAKEFWKTLEDIRETIGDSTNVPILHLECHGSKQGLCLADGTTITWPELKTPLAQLNKATGCNLVVTLACCYGAWLRECLDVHARSPCLALLGPGGEVSPLDLKSSYSAFFHQLLKSLNVLEGMLSIKNSPELQAHYFLFTAEDMFQKVLGMHIDSSKAQHRERTEDFRRGFERQGMPESVFSLVSYELRRAEQKILDQMYNHFFFVDYYPENRSRFVHSYPNVMQ